MLRCTIELVSARTGEVQTLGVVTIANDASGSEDVGNYTVELTKEPPIARERGVWKRGRVKGFPRLKLGPYDLLFRALRSCVGGRNLPGDGR